MRNALDEFLFEIANFKQFTTTVRCGVFFKTFNGVTEKFMLKENWSNDDWLALLLWLNFNYNNYSQKPVIDGTVWFKDGSWFDRVYMGTQHTWCGRSAPVIPTVLLEA